ncbi:hypothetical protein AB0O34_33755 [Sphaerisporangium sp. NPDC088356]|uniref:hypothetical protein n=1 Tax=Sphaerisporangium sp. NPDC088356 TaxID=3154871 RepID=UPI00342ED165
MDQINTKPVTEKKAHADAQLLSVLAKGLHEEGIPCLIVKQVRLVLAYGKVRPVTHHPTELLVFGTDGMTRGRTTIQTSLRGMAYRVTPVGAVPECLFVLTQATEAIAYLRGVARDYNAASSAPSANDGWPSSPDNIPIP